jgi:hypothetical protein
MQNRLDYYADPSNGVWALGAIREAEACFKGTSNGFWVVFALYAARIAKIDAPKWVIDALMDAGAIRPACHGYTDSCALGMRHPRAHF